MEQLLPELIAIAMLAVFTYKVIRLDRKERKEY